jgi:hypothetical protein
MSEEATPPEPTREEELKYLKWLEGSFLQDPVFTIHPKLHTAGPHRLMYRMKVEMRREYRKTFFKNFIICTGLTWPLII